MLTLRQLKYELPDKGDTFLTYIKLDTEKVSFHFADFFVWWRSQIEVDKPWIGEIKNDKFKIIRAKAGLLKIYFSTILVKGQIKNMESKTEIKLGLGLPGYAILSLIFEVLFLTALTVFLLRDIWGLLITTSILTIQILSILIDMNKTENRINEYLERVKATSHNNNYNTSALL